MFPTSCWFQQSYITIVDNDSSKNLDFVKLDSENSKLTVDASWSADPTMATHLGNVYSVKIYSTVRTDPSSFADVNIEILIAVLAEYDDCLMGAF